MALIVAEAEIINVRTRDIGVGALRDTTNDTTTWELADRDAYGTACDSGIAPHSLSFYFIG